MRKIGLTGGISTGKSTVARYLADVYQLPILDADIYARKAVELGSPILAAIQARYGEQVKLPDGNLHRQALGAIIFDNSQEKLWLESLIHPYVRECFVKALTLVNRDTVVLVIPLLFEAKMLDLVTEVWVVNCQKEQQIARLMKRDNLTESEAEKRRESQLALEIKVSLADVVLDNSEGVENLYKQIDLFV